MGACSFSHTEGGGMGAKSVHPLKGGAGNVLP